MKNDLLDSLDKIIVQAKDYLTESNSKKDVIKEVEFIAMDLLRELEPKRNELKDVISQLSTDQSAKAMLQKMSKGLVQCELMIDNVLLLAEQSWFQDKEAKKSPGPSAQQYVRQKRYIEAESMRLASGINQTQKFSELAEYANLIWAEYDLLLDLGRLEELMVALVRRMNEINFKKANTRLSDDLRGTLRHIREEVFSAHCWNDNELTAYLKERDAEILQKEPFDFGTSSPVNILILGMAAELTQLITTRFDFSDGCQINWIDMFDRQALTAGMDSSQLTVIVSNFETAPLIDEIKARLQANSQPYLLTGQLATHKLLKEIKDELAKKA